MWYHKPQMCKQKPWSTDLVWSLPGPGIYRPYNEGTAPCLWRVNDHGVLRSCCHSLSHHRLVCCHHSRLTDGHHILHGCRNRRRRRHEEVSPLTCQWRSPLGSDVQLIPAPLKVECQIDDRLKTVTCQQMLSPIHTREWPKTKLIVTGGFTYPAVHLLKSNFSLLGWCEVHESEPPWPSCVSVEDDLHCNRRILSTVSAYCLCGMSFWRRKSCTLNRNPNSWTRSNTFCDGSERAERISQRVLVGSPGKTWIITAVILVIRLISKFRYVRNSTSMDSIQNG